MGERAILASLWREPPAAAHHQWDLILVIAAHIWREVSFPDSCGNNIDYNKCTGKMVKVIKRRHIIQAVIYHHRELAILAHLWRERT
jgi:hypothetical protein